jgi:Uma2 family endonuclease
MIAVSPALEPSLLRPWTIHDYEQMLKSGILQPDESVELITGQIIRKMSPQGSPHAAAITRANRLFYQPAPDVFTIRIQLPLSLDEFSQPEPDIALVKTDRLDYEERHPCADEVYLIIEIADSTLRSDLNLKKQVYAAAGIPDYWVLDLSHRQLYVYRQPTATGYQQEQILEETAQIAPLAFPEKLLPVASMLKPQ